MKICRYTFENESNSGLLIDGQIHTCDAALQPTGRVHQPENVKYIPPVAPSKIVCVGRNYAEHARELGNDVPSAPLLFLKAPSSIIAAGEPIIIPSQSARVEHEAELAVVIGKQCKNLDDDEDALDYIFGYTCLNDVTARDLQKIDVQFTRAKSFDSFCPIGPFIETDFDAGNAWITCRVNGEIRQRASTAQMVFSVPCLLRYISRQMTLLPGDLIATGTPSGVSAMHNGDVCEVEIEGLGVLSNPVLSASEL